MRRALGLTLLLLALVLAACAAPAAPTGGAPEGEAAPAEAGGPRPGGTLTVALDGEIDTIDPHKSVTIVGFQVYPMVFEGMVQMNKDLTDVVPLLAESWTQPDDTTYVFTLRQGVTFHDGSEFNADDVKYTFDRMMDDATASSRKPDFLPVESVDVIDPYTVQFKLKNSYAPFLTKLENLRIVPNDPANDPGVDPIGTGPFVFKEWITGQSITLEKYVDYWQEGLPYLDSVVYRPIPEPSTRVVELQTGNVDLLNAVPAKDVSTLEQDANLQVWKAAGLTRDHIGFNMESPLFKDNPNLRKAIAWSVDRQTIADTILYGLGQPAQVALPPTSWAYDPTTEGAYGFDLEKAKELYAQADPKPTEITVKVSPTYPDQIKMAELLQAALSEVGIQLNIEQLEWSTWIQQVVTEGNYDLEIVLISGGVDPDDFFYQWHHTGEVFNLWRYSDPEMDQLLDEARATVDQEARKALYAQIQQKLIEDVPLAHIIYRDSVIAGSAALQDFEMTGRYDMDFREVWLDR